MENISEILEPLHRCLREVLENDKNGKSDAITYTDDDVVAATLMFSHVLGNRLIHKMTDEKVSIGMSKDLAKYFGENINVLAKGMADVDLTTVYKG